MPKEGANSKNLIAVVVVKGEIIVGVFLEGFLQSVQCLFEMAVRLFVKLLDPGAIQTTSLQDDLEIS